MDTIVSEANDAMINQLNFGLPETSQYITDRRFVNYFPSGSNVYAPNAGNKNIRFYISGDSNQYLDLSSIPMEHERSFYDHWVDYTPSSIDIEQQ